MPAVTIRLPGEAVSFVRGGGRDIDTAKLSLDPAPAPGQEVRLVDDRDAEVGLAVADPENERLRLLATPEDGLPLGGALLGWRVDRAVKMRRAFGLVADGVA